MLSTDAQLAQQMATQAHTSGSTALLALFATVVFALLPDAEAFAYWGWRPYGWGWGGYRPWGYGYGGMTLFSF